LWSKVFCRGLKGPVRLSTAQSTAFPAGSQTPILPLPYIVYIVTEICYVVRRLTYDPFQHQRGAGSEFASGDQECSSYRHRHERRLSAADRNHQ
jgi:hypothetical protein